MPMLALTWMNEDDWDFNVLAVSDSEDKLKELAFNSEMYPEDEDWTWIQGNDELENEPEDTVYVRIGDYIVYRIQPVEVL